MTRAYLRLTDPGVRRALRHPALAGLPRLGRGAFAAVFDNGDTVLKLTCDPVSYEFAAGFGRPLGDQFPQLVDDHGDVGSTERGDTLFLFEVEKLQPLGRSAPLAIKREAGQLCELIDITWSKHRWRNRGADADSVSSYRALQELSADSAMSEPMRAALEELAMFAGNYEGVIDFHKDNLMLRGDAIVLNDVIVGEIAMRKFNAVRGSTFG